MRDFIHVPLLEKELDILTERVNQIARGAAIQTGCDYEFGPIQNGVNEFIKHLN